MARSPLRSAARVAVWYIPLGLLWVLFHNRAMDAIVRKLDLLVDSATFKDWITFLFGGLWTCAMIFWEVRSEVRAAKTLAKRHEAMRVLVRAAEVQSDDPRRLLGLAAAAVPIFADWCLVDLIEADGVARRAAAVCAFPDRSEDAEQFRQVDLNHPDRKQRLTQVLECGEPIFHPSLTGEMVDATCSDEDERRLLRRLHLRSMITVPISTVGLITFFMAESGRHFGSADLDLAAELAERLGGALEHIDLVRQALTADRGRREAEAARESQERLYRLLADNARDLVLLVNEDGTAQYASPSCLPLLGYTPEELTEMTGLVSDIVHPDDRGMVRRQWEAVTGGEELKLEPFRAIRKDGSCCWLEPIASQVPDSSGGGTQVQVVLRDVSDRVRFEERLAHQAFHDALTGLPNRALLLNRLQRALRGADPRQGQVAVLFMDLDGFKLVNDTLGHEAGDHLLVELGRRLQGAVRAEDTIARMGGDEFAILLESVGGPAEPVMVAERVIEAMRAPVLIGRREVTVNASIGIALASPGKYLESGALLRDADAAMYRAKAGTRGSYELFDPRMNEENLDRLEMEADLRHAVDRNELVLYYQPIVDLRDSSIRGVEALVRWRHPQRGLLGPDRFIPLAEETGLIVPIGRWVLREACRQLKEWQGRFALPGAFYVSVNLSVRQLRQPDVAERIRRHLEATGLAPHCLQLEITESIAMLGMSGKIATLRRIKSLGVRLAMDDFGTGYSSLSYLKQLPFDVLKIDRSFVSALDMTDQAILAAITAVGEALQLELVAEGVETQEQASCLLAKGCRVGQGFYFWRPLPVDLLESLLVVAEPATAD